MAKHAAASPQSEDYRVVLAKKVGPFQAFLLLINVIVAGVLGVAVKETKNGWLVFLILVPVLMAGWLGRKGATKPFSEEGPIWDLAHKSSSRKKANRVLEVAVHSVAKELGFPEDHTRANLWAVDETGTVLRMVSDISLGMRAQEKYLRIPIGTGCAGNALARNLEQHTSNVHDRAPIKGPDGAEYVYRYNLDEHQTQLLDPNLQWIIAAPINSQTGQVVGVVTVDGLNAGDANPNDENLERVATRVTEAAAGLRQLTGG